tara:strand:- start:4163 stop:4384 length:222 start_codon:yes stop_codon:yes gene_type:complete
VDIAVWARSPKLKRKQRANLKVWVGHVATKKGLYANIHAKRKRGAKMRKKGQKGAPTDAAFRKAAKTAKKKKK